MNRIVLNSNQRRGNASLELVLFSPFLCMFLLGLFSITSATLSQCNVEMQARYHAWKFRHTPWRAEETEQADIEISQEQLKIFNNRPRVHPSRFVLHSAEVPVLQFLKGVAPRKVKQEHRVLGGVWDHRVLRFEPHRTLVLDEKVNYFGARIPRRGFRVLGGP